MKYVGVSAPAWTIAGKWKEPIAVVDDKNIFAPPPPAIENHKIMRSVPRLPHVARQRIEREISPPKEPKFPKAVSTKKNTKKPMITQAERFPMSKDAAFGPGPTSYQQDYFKDLSGKMANFSFGYRFSEDNNKVKQEPIIKPPPEDAPIPGLYYPIYSHKEYQRGIKFNKAKHDGLNLLAGSCAPGPGKYVIPEMKGNTSSKKGTFGTPKKIDESKSTKDEDLGYGRFHYEPEKYIPKSRVITRSLSETRLNKKSVESEVPRHPPIYYGNGEFQAKGPKWKFGKGSRPPLNSSTQTNLGPGEYFSLNLDKPADEKNYFPKLPQAKRRPLNENNITPGPGTYPLQIAEDDEIGQKILNKPKGLAYSMRGKYDIPGSVDYLRQPGPGQYEVHNINGIGIELFKHGSIARTFATSSRKLGKVEKNYDGPDMYNLSRDLGSDQGIKFPKSVRRPLATNADPDIDLGPGYYDLKSTVPQLQKFEQDKLDRAEQFNLNLI